MEIRPLQHNQTQLLLADISASMNRPVGGIRKIDYLRRAIIPLHFDVMITFGSRAQVVDSIPEPSGSTALDKALELSLNYPDASAITVVSDGLPDYPEASLTLARRLRTPIRAFFIGDRADIKGAAFMKRLAMGGTYVYSSPLELGLRMTALLHPSTGSTAIATSWQLR